MKKWLLSTLLACALAASNAAMPEPPPVPLLAPLQQQGQAASISAQILTRYHYTAAPLNHALSEKVFDRYLKALDPDKLFFTQAEINRFAAERGKICDAILKQDLHAPFEMFNAYQKRAAERWFLSREWLKQGLAIAQLAAPRGKSRWPASEDELRAAWRSHAGADWLHMKQAGKSESAAKDALDKRYAGALARLYKSSGDEAFETFMNAFATTVDPHTGYFGPKASEDFAIAMSLSLEGIGAVLKQTDDYPAVSELMLGSPAALSGKLTVGDRIVAVAQASDSVMTDVLGWRVDDVVSLIRGAKGTKVRLEILLRGAGPKGNHKYVTLVRSQLNLERQAAKKAVMQLAGGPAARRLGVITLPTFYQDVEAKRNGDQNFRSAARDVENFLNELKAEKVEGVLIDLRDNGGGSLDEAVRLAGLFVGSGPVVQQRDARGKVSMEGGGNREPSWTGPLAVLINRDSASASEIFAAAIQDYGRGVIIGEPSYGKGTVQTVLNLDKMAHNAKPKFGELKLTTTQFFRINGDTTQLRGVTPDIAFPSAAGPAAFGEASFENALPWTQIKAASYARAGDLKGVLETLQNRHAQRVANDRNFRDFARRSDVFDADATKLTDIEIKEETGRAHRASVGSAPKMSQTGKPLQAQVKQTRQAALPGDIAALHEGAIEFAPRKPDLPQIAAAAEKNGQDAWLKEAAQILGNQIELAAQATGSR